MNLGAPHTLNGRTQTLRQWAAEYGLTKGCVASRLGQGKSLAEALSEPARKRTAAPKQAPQERVAPYGVSEVFRAWVRAAVPV